MVERLKRVQHLSLSMSSPMPHIVKPRRTLEMVRHGFSTFPIPISQEGKRLTYSNTSTVTIKNTGILASAEIHNDIYCFPTAGEQHTLNIVCADCTPNVPVFPSRSFSHTHHLRAIVYFHCESLRAQRAMLLATRAPGASAARRCA